MMAHKTPNASFDSILASLTSQPAPLLPPSKPLDPSLTAKIASIQVHPTLEALLHIYNHDLPSAHFLVRHMQGSPAHEGMYIHGLLHRIEGDYANCLAWYTDVSQTEVFQSFYGGTSGRQSQADDLLRTALCDQEQEAFAAADGDAKLPPQGSARRFIRAIGALRRMATSNEVYEERKKALEEISAAEMRALTRWCVNRFGTGWVEDATGAWSQPGEETREIGRRMVSGGEGYRKF